MNEFEEAHEKHRNGPDRNVSVNRIGKKGPDFSRPFSNLRQDIEIDNISLIYKIKNANGINLN